MKIFRVCLGEEPLNSKELKQSDEDLDHKKLDKKDYKCIFMNIIQHEKFVNFVMLIWCIFNSSYLICCDPSLPHYA